MIKKWKAEYSKDNYKLYKKLESEGYGEVKWEGRKIMIELKNVNKIERVSTGKRKVYNNWKELAKGYKQGIGTLIIKSEGEYKTDIECIMERKGGRVEIKLY
jgi:ribosomal protein S8